MSGTLLNIAVFAYEPSEFPDPDKMTVPADRSEIEQLFKGWSPQVADIWKLYPEKLVKWGIFDLEDNPPPTYARGRVCLVGDSAHASTPYLGAGACTGVEDALVICTLLESVQQKALGGNALREALQTYSGARLERGRWIHHHSRQMGQMYHWRYGPTGRDPERMKRALEETWAEVVSYDILAPLEPELRELAMSERVSHTTSAAGAEKHSPSQLPQAVAA
jgi:salicylate hydroxylase